MNNFTRRAVVGAIGSAAIVSPARAKFRLPPARAYIGRNDSIEALAVRNECSLVEAYPCAAPGQLLLHPNGRHLYVTNAIAEENGLPRGTVASYTVDETTGRLRFSGRQPLTLSATRPRGAAITPDGRWLVAAAFEGGIYNSFPIDASGLAGLPVAAYKEAGSGSDTALERSAHPHSMIFDASGRYLISSDFGTDCLSVFGFHAGHLTRSSRTRLATGRGPGSLVFYAPASLLFCYGELDGTLSSYRFDPVNGVLEDLSQCVRISGGRTPLAFHVDNASHLILAAVRSQISAWSIDYWSIDQKSGALARAGGNYLPEPTRCGPLTMAWISAITFSGSNTDFQSGWNNFFFPRSIAIKAPSENGDPM